MTIAFGGDAVPQVELRHRLRIAREFAGLEQSELAEEIGVSRNSVVNYEKGRTTPRKIVINAWAWRCGVSVDWINTGQRGTTPPDGDGAAAIPAGEPPVGIEPTPFAYKVAPLPALKRAA